jgi:HSP20 family protein
MVKREESTRVNLWRLGDVDRLFDRLYSISPPLSSGAPRHWIPDADVFETKDDLVVRMDLAGVSRDAVKVLLDEDTLVITGTRNEEYEEECEYYHQIEVEYGYFRRVIHLPRPVDADKGRALYRDGFLFVVLPKVERPVTIHTTVEIL